MVQLVLTPEQVEVLRTTYDSVTLHSPNGDVMGVVERGIVIRTPEDEQAFIQQSKALAARHPRTGSTTEEVLSRLMRLERPQ